MAQPAGNLPEPIQWHLISDQNKKLLRQGDFQQTLEKFSSDAETLKKFKNLNAELFFKLVGVQIHAAKEKTSYSIASENGLQLGWLVPMENVNDRFQLIFDREFLPLTGDKKSSEWKSIDHIALNIVEIDPPSPPAAPPDRESPATLILNGKGFRLPPNPDGLTKPAENPTKVEEPPRQPDPKGIEPPAASITGSDQEVPPREEGVIKRTIDRLRNFWPTWLLLLPIWPIIALAEWLLKPIPDEEV